MIDLNPTFHPLLLLAGFVLAVVFSWISYRRFLQAESQPLFIGALTARMLALAVILVILLDPMVIRRSIENLQPQWHLYLDASGSMARSRGEYSGASEYIQSVDRLLQRIPEGVSLRAYLFDEHVTEAEVQGGITSIRSKILSELETRVGMTDGGTQESGSGTSFESVLNHLATRSKERSRLAILLSDGVDTSPFQSSGTSPSVSVPLHTLSIGDVISGLDISIQDVVVANPKPNQEGSLNFLVAKNGGESRNLTLRITLSGTVTDEFQLQMPEGASVIRVTRSLNPFTGAQAWMEGLVEVTPIEGEQILDNNSAPFLLTAPPPIIDVYSLVHSIHPDNGAILTALRSDPGIRLHILNRPNSVTLVALAREIGDSHAILLHLGAEEGPTSGSTSDADADSVWRGGTHQANSVNLPGRLASLPSLHIHRSSGTGRGVIPVESRRGPVAFEDLTSPSVSLDSRSQQTLRSLAGIDANSGSSALHPVAENVGLNLPIRQRPYLDEPLPLLVALGELRVQLNETLARTRRDSNSMGALQPILTSFEVPRGSDGVIAAAVNGPDTRRIHFLSSGWHRYFANQDENISGFARGILLQSVEWLRQPPQRDPLELQPLSKILSEGQSVVVRVRIMDELGRPDASHTPDLILEQADDIRRLPLLYEGDGVYAANTGALISGVTRLRVESQLGAIQYESRVDSLFVFPQDLENRRIGLDKERLKSLSTKTGGMFFADLQALETWISAQNAESIPIQRTDTDTPSKSGIWFFAAVSLLTLEWWLRRRLRLP